MAPEKREQDDPEFWSSYHALACREVDRIRRLVDSMRRLGRASGASATTEAVDPVELAQEVVTLLQREASRAQVAIQLECETEIPKIVGVKDHIQQVFINLLLNAVHASPEHGSVRLRVFAERGQEVVCVEVIDGGPGISEDHLERIFDPFFTTKDPDRGTGLGLMICHQIVSDHGGTVEVRSQVGEGATFCPPDSVAPAVRYSGTSRRPLGTACAVPFRRLVACTSDSSSSPPSR
jgi:signal transduction histidine kinase